MKELHSKMYKAHGRLEALCEMCSGGKATAFCRQCTHFICEECVKSHERMKVFAGHVISTLDDLKQGGAKELSLKEIPTPKCIVHEEPTKIFCFDCNQFICRDCVIIDHAGHKYEFVKKAAAEAKQKLDEQLRPLRKVASNLDSALERVKSTKLAIKENGCTSVKQVSSSFQELYDILDQSKQKTLGAVSKMVERKLDSLSAQEKDIDITLCGTKSLIDRAEKSLKNANNEEVLMMHSQLQCRIDSELEKQMKEKMNLEPVEEVDIGVEVSVSEGLKELCQTKTRVFRTEVDPLNCTTEGDGVRTAEVSNVSKFTVYAKLPNHLPTRRSVRVKAELESLVDGSIVRVNGVHRGANAYDVTYTPKIRGRHYLMITVNDQPIAGSPLSVFVKIPPTKFTKPVRIITGVVAYPKFLAFNSSEQLIITEGGGDVFILDKKGEKLQSLSQDEHCFTDGTGVAVDKSDNLYLTDACYNHFYKFNKLGKLLTVFGEDDADSNKLNSPRGVTVVGERVFVCDSWNHRVQVFNTKLEQIEQLGAGGTGDGQFKNPKDIVQDKRDQSLYVTDGGNHRVQVFTNSGEFVRTIGKKGTDYGELSFPVGVSVSDDHVYVVENGNKRVSVFCKDGQFVTSFGEGQFKSPYGVVIDADSFMYVSDSDGSKVNVF